MCFLFSGASVSIVLANLIQPVVLIIYIRVRKLHSLTWGGMSAYLYHIIIISCSVYNHLTFQLSKV